jgi:hypothetical protein
MERFCSLIGNSVKSRRYPYANVDQRILSRARLQVILLKYNLLNKGPFEPRKKEIMDVSTILPECKLHLGSPVLCLTNCTCKDPHYMLLAPHSKPLDMTPQLRRQIIRYLTTSFDIRSHDADILIPQQVEQWGRLQIANGGDLIHARGYHTLRPDGRDASFIRVSAY